MKVGGTEVEELAVGLFRLEQTDGKRRLCQFVVLGDTRAIVVDAGLPGTPDESVLPFLRSAVGSQQVIVVLTHQDADHCGGTSGLQAGWPGLEVVAHACESPPMGDPTETIRQRYEPFAATDGISLSDSDRARAESRLGPAFTVDSRLSSEPTIDIGGRSCQVVHVPGHSAGHLALWVEDEGALICGDAVMGDGIRNRDGSLLFPPQFISPKTYIGTLERLRTMGPALLLCAHEPAHREEDADAFLARSTEAAEDLAALVDMSVSHQPLSLKQLCAATAEHLPELPSSKALDLATSVNGCLEELINQGCVRSLTSGDWRTFEKVTE